MTHTHFADDATLARLAALEAVAEAARDCRAWWAAVFVGEDPGADLGLEHALDRVAACPDDLDALIAAPAGGEGVDDGE